jgi:hypothetical protein
LQATENQVGIGDGQMTVFAVAYRTGVGAGGLGPHHEHAVVKKQAAAAAGGHGLDLQLGCLDTDPGGFRFEHQFVLAAKT